MFYYQGSRKSDHITDFISQTDEFFFMKGGADQVVSLYGNDVIFAGTGNDSVFIGRREGTVFVNGGQGYDTVGFLGKREDTVFEDHGLYKTLTDSDGFQLFMFGVEKFEWTFDA